MTFSHGRPTGPAAVLTLAAGYLAPSLLGAGAAWLLAAHHVTAMLWLLLAVSWLATAAIQAAFGYTAAWFLLLGGVRAVAVLQGHRRRSRRRGQVSTSDADQLARLTGVPGGAWVVVFALICLAALVLGTRLLIPGGLHFPH